MVGKGLRRLNVTKPENETMPAACVDCGGVHEVKCHGNTDLGITRKTLEKPG